jgi:hypothetical protein
LYIPGPASAKKTMEIHSDSITLNREAYLHRNSGGA